VLFSRLHSDDSNKRNRGSLAALATARPPLRLARLRITTLALVIAACSPGVAIAFEPPPPPPALGSSGASLQPVESLTLGAPFEKSPDGSPEALSAATASREAFAHLDRAQAIALADSSFHIDHPSWTPPGKDDGAHISKYLDEHSAQETLPNGERTVVASTTPLRVDGKAGLAPVDLTLHEEGGTFAPLNPLVPVTISKSTGSVAFPSGVSVAPVAANAPEGTSTAGNSVVLVNSAPDTDFIAEPVPQGAELSWQLRSQESPESNALSLNLPPGASLRLSSTMAGAAEVVAESKRLLLIPPAVATDAAGRSLPASYSVSGSTLTTHADLSGTVTFPVMVDPLFVGDYGTANGASNWGSWGHFDTCNGCFSSLIFYNLIQIGTNPGPGDNIFGEWYVYAPGWASGGSGIARVDLQEVIHEAAGQSSIQAGIQGGGVGPNPVYSFNGFSGASGASPLNSTASYPGIPIVFCAQGAGGTDGGGQPLCDENYWGQDFYVADVLGPNPRTVFNYIRVGGAVVTYLDGTPPSVTSFNQGKGGWTQYGPTNTTITASDSGLGIKHFQLEIPAGHSPYFSQDIGCNGPNGFVGCPQFETSQPINLSGLGNGIYEVGAVAEDAAGNATRLNPYPKLYIDHTSPSMPALTGPLAEAAGSTIGSGSFPLKFSAEDGSTASPQSGPEQIQVLVDGRVAYTAKTSCPLPSGIPSSNCFALSGEWTFSGQTWGAGAHHVTVVAKDFTKNTETRSLNVTVNEAESKPVGPGAVNLQTGEYKLTATDVSIASANATLGLTRSYGSRSLEQGVAGPLGPQWSLSVPNGSSTGWQSLTPLPEGAVSVYTTEGQQLIFGPKSGGGWESPAGYQTDTLTEPSTSPAVYQLTDADGNYTRFTQAGAETRFTPSSVAQVIGAGGLNRVSYSFQKTPQGIVEPTKILAPEPSEGACTTTLVKGCRALTFSYASSTTATGEGKSAWGNYLGRLSQVQFTAWDPSKGEMTTTAVAEYSYDLQGRLRAEWDPRISPALKTTYGYDAAGHVTALTPPGQESWAFHYGAREADPNEGRLLSVARPSAGAALWNGSLPSNTSAPALSGSAKVGVKMTINNGAWSNSPVAYAYQWLDCDSEGAHCVPIGGATNPSFTVRSNDQQYTLVAQVSATNGGGTVVASAPHSALVTSGSGTEGAAPPAPEARSTIEYRVPTIGAGLPELTVPKTGTWGQKDKPGEGTAIFPPDKPQSWPATEYTGASIYYLDGQNRTVNVASPTGGVSVTEYDSHNNVTRSLSPDNRATAIASGTKSVETAQALETKSEYSADGTELLSVLGPQHNVKLAGGSEVLARKHTVYSYDEGAPGTGGPYRIVTKTTEGAQLSSGEEREVRVTKSSYSGQEGLGWKLHAPTVSEADPGNLDLIHKVKYDSQTGNVLEDSSPGASSETIYPPVFTSSFGSEGSGNGQLIEPSGVATDAAGNRWVVDSGNGRVEKFSASGSFIASYGTKGAGELQFKGPWGIAINQSSGAVYVADEQNNRIEELSSSGAYVASLGTSGPGTLAAPTGVAVDATGDVWAADQGHSRVVEFSPEGSYIQEVGGAGSGSGQLKNPDGLVFSEGSLYVLDTGDSRVVQFSPSGTYLGQFGSKGSGSGQFNEPAGIAVNSSTGYLDVADPANARIEEFSPAGRFLTQWGTASPSHPPNTPVGLAVGATGTLLVSDPFGDKVSSWAPPEAGAAHLAYASQFGSLGSGSGQFSSPGAMAIDGEGNEWVTDFGNNRIEKFSSKGIFIAAFGTKGTGNGQFNGPEGIDINQSTGYIYVADSGNRRIEKFSSAGTFIAAFGSTGSGELKYPDGVRLDSAGDVWTADIAANRIVEFSATGTFMAAYGKEGSGEVQFKEPSALAFSGEHLYVSDTGNHRIQELTMTGAFIRQFGINGQGSGELEKPEGIGTDAAGNLYVADLHGNHVEEFTASGGYLATFGSSGTGEGQMTHPSAVSIDAGGSMYVVDSGDARVEKWTRANQAAHTTKTIYYSSSANGEYPSCGGHGEWVGLPCQAQPAQQPQAFGLQKLPVTTYAYNVWDEPVTTTDTVGSTTRTTTIGYDSAGRTQTKAISSSIDTPVPTTTFKYATTTGLLTEESTSTKSLKSAYNALGELESYTDADGNISTFSYDVNGRTEKTNDGKGTQSITYATSGLPEQLKDSAAGSFTASYDVEGNMVAEGYPNGMSAKYTLAPTGQPTNLEYVKTTHCSSSCVWYSDQVVPSIHDQWLSQTSSLSKESYAYDGAARLTEVQETPAGKGCTSRVYTLDEDGNRTALTTRAPGAEGKCSTEGGTTERHLYDEGDRLADEGVSYEAFGNTTALPGADAGGVALTSTYYTNDSLASQSQGGQAISYALDPAGRTREAVKTGTLGEATTSHYEGGADSPAWTVASGGAWTRYVSAFSGLAAIQTSAGSIELELANLHGDIVAKASPSETETKPLSSTDTTEYGVPTVGTPARYSWMGNEQRPTELPSGMIAMGARSYIPQLGRFEQSDPQPGGSGDAYSYTDGDPVNTSDPSGAFTNTVTYDYEAASAGAAEGGLAEHWIAPGALMPPPVDLQIEAEFNAHPPWDAVSVLESQGSTSGFLRYAGDPVSGEGELSPCNRTGQHCPGCRNGGKKVKGVCQPPPRPGHGDFCEAMVVNLGAPAMWTAGGLAGIALGEGICKLGHATGQG
jgi:RHS repeat-associated protein